MVFQLNWKFQAIQPLPSTHTLPTPVGSGVEVLRVSIAVKYLLMFLRLARVLSSNQFSATKERIRLLTMPGLGITVVKFSGKHKTCKKLIQFLFKN